MLHKNIGWDNFIFGEIIEYCSEYLLDEREMYWIDYLHTFDLYDNRFGYNLTEGGGKVCHLSGELHPFFGKERPEHAVKMSRSK